MLPGAHRAGKWSPDACTQIAMQRESNMTFHVLQHKANVHTFTHTFVGFQKGYRIDSDRASRLAVAKIDSAIQVVVLQKEDQSFQLMCR